MVQAKLDLQWVPDTMLPASFDIAEVKEFEFSIKGKTYIGYLLHLIRDGQVFAYEAKFGDKNFLINTISPETDNWVGERIGIRKAENGYKQLCKATTTH